MSWNHILYLNDVVSYLLGYLRLRGINFSDSLFQQLEKFLIICVKSKKTKTNYFELLSFLKEVKTLKFLPANTFPSRASWVADIWLFNHKFWPLKFTPDTRLLLDAHRIGYDISLWLNKFGLLLSFYYLLKAGCGVRCLKGLSIRQPAYRKYHQIQFLNHPYSLS